MRGSTAGRSSSSPKHGVVELVADMNYVSLILTTTLIERYDFHKAEMVPKFPSCYYMPLM